MNKNGKKVSKASGHRDESGLTHMQKAFALEYLVDLNASAAATRAGYSPKNAKIIGHDLLHQPEIAKIIQSQMDKRAAKVGVTAEIILNELLKIAVADIAQAFNDNGDLLPIKEMPEEIRRAIAGIEIDAIYEGFGEERIQIGQNKKIKFWEKTKALEALGRHLKLFTDKIEVGVEDELAMRMARARARVTTKSE